MRALLSMSLGLAMLLMLSLVGQAADDKKADDPKPDAPKEVTLKGSITCAKCDLKVEGQKACATVIQVKEGDKEVVYYLDVKSHKTNHTAVCREAKPGSVTGTVSEKDGKKIITATKVNFDEKK